MRGNRTLINHSPIYLRLILDAHRRLGTSLSWSISHRLPLLSGDCLNRAERLGLGNTLADIYRQPTR